VSETGDEQDWTEKYRPNTIREMEGNSPQIRSIRQWLESWTGNVLPKKRGILLSGPPGVGKTTIAKAVASEKGWAIIELNASEERNAASIRRAATRGSQHISLDLFSSGSVPDGKTIILLDEVDHLAGGFSKISEERIGRSLSPDDDASSISGDSGGKAELMNLLEISKQPVIMTCNDPMRLWGGGRSWRMNRDRILRVAEMIQFKRVSPNDMRKIAYRILDREGVKIDPGALEEIVSRNPGDLRALVRDIQATSTLAEGFITVDEVRGLSTVAIRDSQIDVFRAMKEIYASRSGAEASEILRNSDKDPDQMLAWFSWNNLSVFDTRGLSTISEAMELADKSLATKFTNRAFRSWYWGSALTSQAAVSQKPITTDPYLGYPDFLRRGGESWRTVNVVASMSESVSTSRSSFREELWPLILAVHDESLGGDPLDFSLARKMGLGVEEHLSLHGIAKSSRQGKAVIKKFEELDDENEIPELVIENNVTSPSSDEPETKGKQFTLDSF
tara:strand:- start:8932 stop:10446 length:1515 start_codon:yes stop_codon:yes gene_type:complete